MKRKRYVSIILIVVAAFIGYLFLMPLLFMLATSFKTMSESISAAQLLPQVWTLENYLSLFKNFTEAPILRWLLNTFVVTVLGVFTVLTVDVLAAYALARLQLPLRKVILAGLIWVLAIPGIVTVFPAFYLFKTIGLTNSFIPLILPYGANVMGILLIYNFLLAFPRELEESALVDGASLMGILLKVVLPSIKPVLMTLGFITFIQIYNDYLWPSLVVSGNEMKTITIGVASMVLGANFVNPGMMMAATVVAVLPALLLFLFVNKHIVRGINNSGIK